MRSLAILLLTVLALPAVAAPRVEYVTTVTADSRMFVSRRPIGDPRYISLGVHCDKGTFEILDLATTKVIRHGGPQLAHDCGDSYYYGHGDEVVHYTPARSVLLTHKINTYSFVEIDNKTGKTARKVNVGKKLDRALSGFVGSDDKHAWFTSIEFLNDKTDELVIRRLELATFKLTIEARVPKSGGTAKTSAQASADFSWFMTSDDQLVVTNLTGTTYRFPGSSAPYGKAFSPDNKYAYINSSDKGTISRVDLATGKLDRTVKTIYGHHHLVPSPDGKHLFALGSNNKYDVFDLPGLGNRKTLAHDSKIAEAMGTMFGGGGPSVDRKYFVVAEPDPPEPNTGVITYPPKRFAITRLVD